MADNFENEFVDIKTIYGNYFVGSGDDETEESKQNDDSENADQKDVTVVEENVKSAIPEPESLTLEELANSDFIRNRQLAAKSIVEYLHQAGSNKEALHSVISIMCKLSEDEDLMVRSELMEHIPSIALFCKENSEDLGVVIRQQIVPYTVKLLTDIQRQVRKIGHTTLLVLLENNVIDNSQLSEWICPLIAQLATSENTPQELRLEDVSVMCKMIPYVGKEITEKFFLEPFLSLCRDSSSSAREVCMLNFGNVSRVIGRDATETTLLSAFLDLCQDASCQIKSKCVDIAVDLASVVSPTTRNEILSHVYISFLKNKSRGVWYSACQSLGRFISTFADPSKTGLSYSDGMWIDIPVEDENTEDQQKNENYFELLTSEIISNPQFLDECSFKNLNSCLFDYYSSDDELPQIVFSEINNSKYDVIAFHSEDYCSEHLFRSPKNKQTQYHSKSITALSEKISDRNSNINSEMSDMQNSLNCDKKHVTNSPLSLANKDGHLYLHVDNENTFNNFQFWRAPLPEVELNIDIEECKSASINLRAKLRNEEGNSHSCASELYRLLPKQSSKEPDKTLKTDVDTKVTEDEENDPSKLCLNHSFLQLKKYRLSQQNHRKSGLLLSKEKLSNQMTKKEKQITNKEKIVYEQDIVPPELLMEFINNMFVDGDFGDSLAYYFPSVAYTLGRKYWPCIRDLFNSLATNIQYKVRRTIASSLHELAVILGQDITTEDLLPVFLEMLRDVRSRSSLLTNISPFLKKLKLDARRQFLPLIQGICSYEEDSNWRYRLTVAEQFIPCVELFTSSEALHFLPVSLLLLQDKVSAVRRSAVELLAVTIKSMAANSKSSDFLKAALCALDEKYRKANRWLWRQMYVYICQELAVKRSLPIEFYVDEIVPNLFSLAWDAVPNVRLAVARCLGLTLLPLDFLPSIQKTQYQLLLRVMYSLQSDVDKDVRHFALLSAAVFNVHPPKKESRGSQFNKCEEWWEKSD